MFSTSTKCTTQRQPVFYDKQYLKNMQLIDGSSLCVFDCLKWSGSLLFQIITSASSAKLSINIKQMSFVSYIWNQCIASVINVHVI